ncbi:hypothetical protein ACTFIW_002401 [Dictyostelium discoideum]
MEISEGFCTVPFDGLEVVEKIEKKVSKFKNANKVKKVDKIEKVDNTKVAEESIEKMCREFRETELIDESSVIIMEIFNEMEKIGIKRFKLLKEEGELYVKLVSKIGIKRFKLLKEEGEL